MGIETIKTFNTMKNPDIIDLETVRKKDREPFSFDPLAVFNLLRTRWYWLVIGAVIGFLGARFYINHTLPVYETSATILINETENRAIVDNTQLLQGLGLPGGMQNIENQMMILRSRELTEQTLKELPFEVEYYFKTFRNKLPIYPQTPVKIVAEGDIPLPRNTEFMISYVGNNSFVLSSKADHFPFNKAAAFGDIIEQSGGIFSVECRDYEWLESNKDKQLCFIIHNRNSLVRHYSSRLKVDMVSRGASMLRVSIAGTNPQKDADFINKHLEGFQFVSLDKKNQEADRRIQFIDSQLDWISDTLSTTENRLQQFRSAHRVMDLSTQGQSIVAQATLLENEKARLNLEANYYDYLADYLTKDASGEMPIIPITMGINDAGLTRLVEELAALQGQLASTGAGELNPLQRNLEQRVRSTKDALRETLNGLRRANSLARSENQEQINRANAQASALPVTERMLVGIERKFRLNDELYTFLLETRAEQQMQKASNKSDNEVIDRADARFSALVAPDPLKVNFIGLFAGIGIPFLILFLSFLLDNRIKEEEIQRMTTIPVLGTIPRSDLKTNTVIFSEPNSNLAEAFRLLRSKMQFFTKEAASPVIMVTSPMPGDGKTFVSINLASVYSLLGKKTVLIGFDLRKPKIYEDFNLENNKGVSTWLIGQDKLDDIISATKYDNLYVIPAGPVPPNPSELTALSRTQELIKTLKSRFDFIIIDTSPIGIVSDTYHLASMADVSLLVVRNGMSMKDMFIKTINEIHNSELKGVSIIVNDVKSWIKHYGYSEKYGYTKNSSSKRRLFKTGRRK